MDKFVRKLAPGEAPQPYVPSRKERLAVARARALRFFKAELGVDPDNRPARRPTKEEDVKYKLLEQLADRYAAFHDAAEQEAVARSLATRVDHEQ